MAILKIFLVFITMACPSTTDQIDDDLQQFKEFLALNAFLSQTEEMPDRGYIARRDVTVDELMSKEITIVEQYTSTLEKELECSFVFSALVHMYLTSIFLSEPEKLGHLSEEEINDMTFTEESLYMVKYALDKQKSSLLDVMWIFHFLVLRTEELIQSYKTKPAGLDSKTIIAAYAAVENLLEEFTESYKCKVYNRETGEILRVKYVDKIKEVMKGRTNDTPLTLASNKLRFSNQQSSNAYRVKEHTRLVHFRLYILMKNRCTMNELFNTFGIHVDSKPIVNHFIRCHQDTYNVDVPLQEYISRFISSQIEFIIALKAMALRFVLVFLNYMKNRSATLSIIGHFSMLNSDYGECIKKMTTFLTNFASCVGQPNDYHLNEVRKIFNYYFWNFRTVSQYDKYINSVLDSINDMTSGNSDFATLSCPLTEEDYGKMAMITDIVNKFEISSCLNILRVADIFIMYIQKITGGIDMEVMNSLFRLKESKPYKCLVEPEIKAD